MVKTNKDIGKTGEDLSVEFLLNNGFKIIERNYRYKHFEIDIIAEKNNCLHFIEVKYRKTNNYGYPETFVSNSQKERIKTASENFILEKKWKGNILFDIIAIENNNKTITIFEDAY